MDALVTAYAPVPQAAYLEGRRPNPFLAGKHRPLVVGHRGVPKLHPENTLAGFRRAVALGIDAVELDVRVTRDGRAVVFHDGSVERLTGARGRISDLTWDEVSKLRIRTAVAVGTDPAGEMIIARYDREERISLLAEVLAEVGDAVAINIELKSRWQDDDVSGLAAEAVTEAGISRRVMFTSFDPRRLRELARIDPDFTIGYCWDEAMLGFAGMQGRKLLGHALATNLAGKLLGTQAVGADHTLVGHDTVDRLHRAGVAIGAHVLFPLGWPGGKRNPWAAMSPAEAQRLIELGVDWIESDDPERLQRLVG